MKRVVYTSPYVPGPLIAAHGLEPCYVTVEGGLDRDGNGPMEGVCTYAHSFIQEVLSDDACSAIVLTTTCDQMRRAADWIQSMDGPHVFLMNVPRLEASPQTIGLYREELKRLGRFLEGLGGRPPSDRKLAQALQMPPKQDIQVTIAPKQNKIPLALVGGPLPTQDRELFALVESCGGQIVLDATETGLLGQCHGDVPETSDPRDKLVQRYFVQRWDVGRRPVGDLYRWLDAHFKTAAVRGVLFRWNLWCDLWHGELACFKQHIALPVLGIEATGNMAADRSRLLTRIGAFIEMVT